MFGRGLGAYIIIVLYRGLRDTDSSLAVRLFGLFKQPGYIEGMAACANWNGQPSWKYTAAYAALIKLPGCGKHGCLKLNGCLQRAK